MSLGGRGKGKIVGALKKEILRLAALAPFDCAQGEQDDYPHRIEERVLRSQTRSG